MNFFLRFISSIILIPLVILFLYKGSIIFIISLTTFCFISIYEWIKLSKTFFIKFVGSIFIIFSFTSIYILRYFDNEKSFYNLIFILLICVSTDLGGYIFGKVFKGPNFTKISPNKTYAGILGSYILSIFFSMIFYKYYSSDLSFSNLSIIHIIFYVLFVSTISQIGDLIVSFFKRKAGVKDTGFIIPGHGGLLDRIDGIIFVFPILLILLIKFL